MTDELIDKLLTYFWESIEGMQWDVWCDTSSTDKERIAVKAVVELGLTDRIDEVYDLFWEWADGLEEDSFLEFNSLEDEN